MTDEPDGEDGDGGIPLDISGHEEREAPGASDGSSGERSDPRDRDDPREEAADAFPGGDESADGADGGADATEPDANDAPDPDAEDASPAVEAVEAVVPDVETDEDGEAVQPVELLVQLAKEGEIDPWDIDIVEVTDKFLDRLQDSDLRTSARALFYASVLLRMKGDDLMTDDEPEEPEPEPWEPGGREPGPGAEPDTDPVEALEAEMERRLERKRVRGQPETLEELVHELREAERNKWWKEARTYDTSGSPSGYGRGTQTLDYRAGDDGRVGGEPTEQDVTGTTHEEDIEAVIDDVRTALRERYEAGREEVLYAEVEEAGGSRVMTYLALLFLAHRGQVHLDQDELFGDLWIRDAGALAGADEAVAD